AKEFGARGISVNAVGPGPMDTPFFYPAESDDAVAYHKTAAALSPFTPTGLTHIEDVVPFIRHLVSDTWWMTGQTILINGGYTTRWGGLALPGPDRSGNRAGCAVPAAGAGQPPHAGCRRVHGGLAGCVMLESDHRPVAWLHTGRRAAHSRGAVRHSRGGGVAAVAQEVASKRGPHGPGRA